MDSDGNILITTELLFGRRKVSRNNNNLFIAFLMQFYQNEHKKFPTEDV